MAETFNQVLERLERIERVLGDKTPPILSAYRKQVEPVALANLRRWAAWRKLKAERELSAGGAPDATLIRAHSAWTEAEAAARAAEAAFQAGDPIYRVKFKELHYAYAEADALMAGQKLPPMSTSGRTEQQTHQPPQAAQQQDMAPAPEPDTGADAAAAAARFAEMRAQADAEAREDARIDAAMRRADTLDPDR